MARRDGNRGSWILGAAFVLSGNILSCGCLSTLLGVDVADVGDWAGRLMRAPGLAQLLWAVPLAALLVVFGRRRTAIGIGAAAVFVALLNLAGLGLVAAGVLAPPGG